VQSHALAHPIAQRLSATTIGYALGGANRRPVPNDDWER
jgi:hypothetical protein